MLAIDLVASALALLVLSPVVLVIAALIFFADGRLALPSGARQPRQPCVPHL
jgi:lipopolysaccharide/colanic/teichoic acid biosynthesis glycosyltransferase